MTIGQRIKDIRVAANLSQQSFADRIGVSRVTVANWEGSTNVHGPSYRNIEAISSAFGVTKEWLIKGSQQDKKYSTSLSEFHLGQLWEQSNHDPIKFGALIEEGLRRTMGQSTASPSEQADAAV